jgi:hypothetical protein
MKMKKASENVVVKLPKLIARERYSFEDNGGNSLAQIEVYLRSIERAIKALTERKREVLLEYRRVMRLAR